MKAENLRDIERAIQSVVDIVNKVPNSSEVKIGDLAYYIAKVQNIKPTVDSLVNMWNQIKKDECE